MLTQRYDVARIACGRSYVLNDVFMRLRWTNSAAVYA
jgi:hypothetical protein